MNVQFVFLAFALGAFFELSYLFFIQFLYKAKNKKVARIANTFLYEITPKFYEKTSFINYILIFGVLVLLFPFIYLLIERVNTYSVTLFIIETILIFCLICIPFIGLDKLREHLFLDLGAIVASLALTGMESFYTFQLYRLYRDNYQLAAMIVSLVLFVFVLALIINPKLFDLKNDMDEQGNPSRKKIIYLALSEWLLYPIAILSLIPLLLVSVK